MAHRPPIHSLIFFICSIFLAPFLILYAAQLVWLQSIPDAWHWMFSHSAAVWLFWGVFSILALTIFGFCRRLFWGYLPPAALVMVLTIISRYKDNINGAPLQLSDFSFFGSLGDIAGYAAAQLIPSGMTILGALLAFATLEVMRRFETWHLPAPVGFAIGGICLALLASAVYPGALQTAAAEQGKECQNQTERNSKMGVALGLYSAWSERLQVESGTADPAIEALAYEFKEDMEQPQEPLPLDQAPDIIFVTSESFFDVTRLPGLTFDQDPLPVFHELSETCTNGRFLSNTYGGGTGYVEMEMFTALSASKLKEGDTLCTLPASVYQELPTTVRLLGNAGYHSTAIHAHTDELYNRSTNYPSIGFEEVLFWDDFLVPAEKCGPFVSDEAFAKELIARYEARDPSAPYFLYGMSMENHQGYTPDKYPEPSGFTATSDKLTEGDLAILDALVQGLNHADASLGMLVDYFSQVDRPVILVFVGDHLPSLNLTDGESIYSRLGSAPGEEATYWEPDAMFEMLTTDYLVWTNYETTPVEDHTESCTFLGLHTLERAGVPLDEYFHWLSSEVSTQMLFSRNKFFTDPSGSSAYEVPEGTLPVLEQYTAIERNLVYDR